MEDYQNYMEAYEVRDGQDSSFRAVIEKLKYDLDWLNLEVAKFRLKHGMSTGIIHLYGNMGRLSERLMVLESEVDRVENLWQDIDSKFQALEAGKEVS